ncbi:5,6-dimethylbenzimidazole synthase [Streptomyces sp. 4N509B]|uniref:5,6-dimethylbenzimidazole synthase n=1 Tax=Streptomyces sp. 4N509B TaxID=3457413 RepID=UPI003FCF6EBE
MTQEPLATTMAYADSEREAVYRVMRERRDVRHGYRPDPIPDEVLTRVLSAGHLAGSVGLVQPWDFVLLRSTELRRRILDHVLHWRREYAESLPAARARKFMTIKIEAILDAPVNLVVTADTSRGGRHVLGARTQPYAAAQSATLAVQNIWLAARAEGIGVNMMGFFEERHLARLLGLPDHLSIVAYLCMGYVERFPPAAELELANWGVRRPLSWVVHHETYGRRGLPGERVGTLLEEIVGAVAERTAAAEEAGERGAAPTLPEAVAGGLGAHERELTERLTRLAGSFPPPPAAPAAVAVFAADVTDFGDRAGEPGDRTGPGDDETARHAGGAAVARRVTEIATGRDPLARQSLAAGAELAVVDLGTATGVTGPLPVGVTPRRVPSATTDGVPSGSLTGDDALAAVEAGIETARELVIGGARCLTVTGIAGTGDRKAAVALVDLLLGTDGAELSRALAAVAETAALEEAAAAGFVLAAAAHRVPVVLAGPFGNAAALLAQRLAPTAVDACVFLATPDTPAPRGLTAPPLRGDATPQAGGDAGHSVAALARVERLSLASHGAV